MTRAVLGVFLLLTAAPGSAGVLISSPLSSVGGNDVRCRLTNASKKSVDLVVEFIDSTGTAQVTNLVTLDAGGAMDLTGPTGINNPNYCRISGKFSKGQLRAMFCNLAALNQGVCVPLQ